MLRSQTSLQQVAPDTQMQTLQQVASDTRKRRRNNDVIISKPDQSQNVREKINKSNDEKLEISSEKNGRKRKRNEDRQKPTKSTSPHKKGPKINKNATPRASRRHP